MQRALRRSASAVGPLKDPRGMRNSPRSLAIVRLHYRVHIGARDAAALCCLRSLGARSSATRTPIYQRGSERPGSIGFSCTGSGFLEMLRRLFAQK